MYRFRVFIAGFAFVLRHGENKRIRETRTPLTFSLRKEKVSQKKRKFNK